MGEANELEVINNKIKDLSERVENIESQMKKDKEEKLKKLEAELEYAKFCCTIKSLTYTDQQIY